MAEREKKRRKVSFGLDPDEEKKQQKKDQQEEIHLKQLKKLRQERKLEEEEEENGGVVERGEHPLGIQPLGNWLLFSMNGGVNARDTGLGTLSRLPDALILEILASLEARDLAVLCQVSRSFYVFGSWDDLWKELTLSEYKSNFQFKFSWKNTYIAMKMGNKDFHFTPLKIRDFFSDHFYQSWFCASMGFPRSWILRQNIPRCSNLSLDEFNQKYRGQNTPVILTDVVNNWEAYKKWDQDYLVKICEGKKMKAGPVSFTMENYIRYANETRDELPLYIFDKKFADKIPQFREDYEIPQYFQEDFFSILETRPDFRWLVAGPPRSGSSFHVDPNSTSAWNALIRGRKKWVMFPPGVTPPGVHPSADGADVTSPISVMEWFKNYYKATSQLPIRPLECVAEAGEIIYVPSGWWHIVLNLDYSIAVTQNFVDSKNMGRVLSFLENKVDQISGTNEKETLYSNFVEKLKVHHPSLLEAARKQQEEREKKKVSVWEDKVVNSSSETSSFSLLSLFNTEN